MASSTVTVKVDLILALPPDEVARTLAERITAAVKSEYPFVSIDDDVEDMILEQLGEWYGQNKLRYEV